MRAHADQVLKKYTPERTALPKLGLRFAYLDYTPQIFIFYITNTKRSRGHPTRDRFSFCPIKPLSRLPHGGDASCSSNKLQLGNSTTLSPRKGLNPMPSPLGEGQTDMPINHLHLGEVHPARDRFAFDPRLPRQL